MKIENNGEIYILDIETTKELGLLKNQNSRCKSWEEFVNKYKTITTMAPKNKELKEE